MRWFLGVLFFLSTKYTLIGTYWSFVCTFQFLRASVFLPNCISFGSLSVVRFVLRYSIGKRKDKKHRYFFASYTMSAHSTIMSVQKSMCMAHFQLLNLFTCLAQLLLGSSVFYAFSSHSIFNCQSYSAFNSTSNITVCVCDASALYAF